MQKILAWIGTFACAVAVIVALQRAVAFFNPPAQQCEVQKGIIL